MNLKQLRKLRLLPSIAVFTIGIAGLTPSSCLASSKLLPSNSNTQMNARGQAKGGQPVDMPVANIKSSTTATGQAKGSQPVDMPVASPKSSTTTTGQATQSVDKSTSGPKTKASAKEPVNQTSSQSVYTIDGVQFSYSSAQFVVEAVTSIPSQLSSSETVVQLWTRADYQQVRSGEFKGDLPPHAIVSIHPNPQELPLQDWIEQRSGLPEIRNFQAQAVAGQSGIAFIASGRFEQEHIAFADPREDKVILISFAKINQINAEDAYRAAFEEMVSSLTLTNITPYRSS